MDESQLTELLEHLRYELDMLFGTYERLEVPSSDLVCGNALIESFCLHARQLLDFFNNEQGLRANEFTTAQYVPLTSAVVGVSETLAQKLNTQIAHLTKKRVSVSTEKIGADDRDQLRSGLERALRHFEAHLRPPFRDQWGSYSTLPAGDAAPASATNSVTIVSTRPTTSGAWRIMGNSVALNRTVSEG